MARGEVRIMVDLNAEDGRKSGDVDRTIYCHVRQTTVVRMASLHGYLNKTVAFDNSVLCAISKSV